MKRWHLFPLWVAAALLWGGTAWGGNRKMIDQRVQELDRINREVVQQLPDLPRDGRVHVRAKVQPDAKKVEILESEVIPPPRSEARNPAAPDDSLRSLSSALRDRARGAAQIRPYRDDNRNGEYPRFREALIATLAKRP
jgi:hypothetical protein